MAIATNTYFNRKAIDLRTSKVDQVLPDYFKTDYPNLIKFLEYYYEFMDSDGTHAFSSEINELFKSKDIELTSLTLLDNIFKDIGLGASQSFFKNPRDVAAQFAKYYRVKGSLYSIEGFFRAFFGEHPDVTYPKHDIFTVGESEVGVDSQKFLTNNKRYQIFSILIKSSLSASTWTDLYKQFVHPAGFYFEGEVSFATAARISDSDSMPISIPSVDPVTAISTAQIIAFPTTNITAIYPDAADADSLAERTSLESIISKYSTAKVSELISSYHDIEDVVTTFAPKMDDSAQNDSAGSILEYRAGITIDTSLENMDKDDFDQ